MKRNKFHFIIFALGFMFFLNILNAQTWSPTRRLTYSSGNSFDIEIALDTGNNIHVVWYDTSPGNSEIFYKRSTDGGANWLNARRLTYSSGNSFDIEIALDAGNNIHVVWYDTSPGNSEIFYKRSMNGGTNWSNARRLTYNSGDSLNPHIAIDTVNNIHVVWEDTSHGNRELFYKRSTDGGANWSPANSETFYKKGIH